MSDLDLSPAPGTAPTAAKVWAHARTEALLVARNGEQLLLALVIPVGLMVGGSVFGGRLGTDLSALAPSVLALAVRSSTFTSLAITTGFERRDGVLERLIATPLGQTGLIVGKSLAVVMLSGGQLIVLGGSPLDWVGVRRLLPSASLRRWLP